MKIGIIGVSGHASKHLEICRQYVGAADVFRYHPKGQSSGSEGSWKDILKSDGVVISSPTSTHEVYLEALREDNFNGYVYLEKPGLSTSTDIGKFRTSLDFFSGRLIIGYHMIYSQPIKRMHDEIKLWGNNFTYGQILLTKDICLNDSFKSGWRGKYDNAITETLLSHNVSVAVALLGRNVLKNGVIKRIKIKGDVYDTALCDLSHSTYQVKCMASWALPRVSLKVELISEKGTLFYHEGVLKVIRLIENSEPFTKTYSYKDPLSISNSVNNFIAAVKEGRYLSTERVLDALEVSKICALN